MIWIRTKKRRDRWNDPPIGPGFRALSRFLHSEHGAITIDWVVLTAAVVGLGAAATMTIGAGTTANAEKMEKCLNIQSKLHSRDIAYDKTLKRIARRCGRL